MLVLKRALVCLLACLSTAQHAKAEDRVQIITSRSDKAIELFLSMPTEVALEKFGLTAADLTNARGYADFDLFATGTFKQGQDFWQGTKAWVDGEPVGFEAMSLMMHPVTTPLPFRKPLDALTAIEVCGTVLEDIPLSDTRIYVGFIAAPDRPAGDLVIAFAQAFDPGTKLHVRDFSNHKLMLSSQFDADGDNVLTIAGVDATEKPFLKGLPLVMISTFLVGLAYAGTRGNGPFFA